MGFLIPVVYALHNVTWTIESSKHILLDQISRSFGGGGDTLLVKDCKLSAGKYKDLQIKIMRGSQHLDIATL